jgi:hypothetical protein
MTSRPATDGSNCGHGWPIGMVLPTAADSMANSEATSL